MGRAKHSGGSGYITRQAFLRRVGTVGIIAAGGFAILDVPIASAPPPQKPPKPTKPPTTSGYTMTLGGPGAPSKISGSVAVAKDDPRILFRDAATRTRAEWPYDVLSTGLTPDWAAGFEVDFMYNGRRLETYEYATGQRFTPIFDNVIGTVDRNTPADYTLRYRLLDFGTAATRRVRLQLNTYLGLRIESGSTVSSVQTPLGRRVIFLGDSYTEGTYSATGSLYGGYVITTGLQTGLDAWPSGIGGTGIINDFGGADGRVKFRDRVPSDVIRFAPDVVVIAGGINDRLSVADGTVTSSQYRAECDALIEAIRTGLPAAKIVVLGPFCPGTPSSYTGMTQIRDLNQAAAQAAGLPFIDVFYFTDAMRSSYVSADGFHLNAAGHDYLGKKLGADLVPVLG
jgi:lysophospholipase L1-like esterase